MASVLASTSGPPGAAGRCPWETGSSSRPSPRRGLPSPWRAAGPRPPCGPQRRRPPRRSPRRAPGCSPRSSRGRASARGPPPRRWPIPRESPPARARRAGRRPGSRSASPGRTGPAPPSSRSAKRSGGTPRPVYGGRRLEPDPPRGTAGETHAGQEKQSDRQEHPGRLHLADLVEDHCTVRDGRRSGNPSGEGTDEEDGP